MQTAKHDTVDVPASKMKIAIANILLDEGYIEKYDLIEDGVIKTIHITLKYGETKNDKIITGLKRISKPGLRVYAGKDESQSPRRTWRSDPFYKPGRDHRQRSTQASGWRRSSGICLVNKFINS